MQAAQAQEAPEQQVRWAGASRVIDEGGLAFPRSKLPGQGLVDKVACNLRAHIHSN